MPKLTTAIFLVLALSACSQSSPDPAGVGGALQKVQPVAKPPQVAPPVVVPTQIDRAFDVEENKPADLQTTKVAPTATVPGVSPGTKPINPTVKPLSPPPTGG